METDYEEPRERTEVLEKGYSEFTARVYDKEGNCHNVEVRSISKLVERYSGENLSNSL